MLMKASGVQAPCLKTACTKRKPGLVCDNEVWLLPMRVRIVTNACHSEPQVGHSRAKKYANVSNILPPLEHII